MDDKTFTKEEIMEMARQVYEQQFDVNYFSGSPRIPPHTHNGIDNLPVASNTSEAWPVGSLFLSTLSTDPNALLGYGNWAQYAEGQVLVGLNGGDPNFGTLGQTGGVTDVTLSTTQIPSHSHKVNSGGTGGALDSGAGTAGFNAGGSGTVTSVQATGGGGSHTNLQPYITVIIWQRLG